MKYLGFALIGLMFFTSCGNKPDGPLEAAEIEEIEDALIAAMEKKKIIIYADKALNYEMSFEDFSLICPEDSTGRQDLSGFGIITEEEIAISNNDFSNTSTEMAAISLYVLIQGGQVPSYYPIGLLSWKDVKKALNSNQEKRFYAYLLNHFNKNLEQYNTEIAKTRLDAINQKLFAALKDGTIAAYENDNLSSIKSPGELEGFLAHKEEQMVPDPNDTMEMVLQFVEIPIGYQDISHYLPAYDEDDNVVAVTMMITESIQGYPLKTPWVAIDFNDLSKALSEPEMIFLQNHLEEVMQSEEEIPATDSLEINS